MHLAALESIANMQAKAWPLIGYTTFHAQLTEHEISVAHNN